MRLPNLAGIMELIRGRKRPLDSGTAQGTVEGMPDLDPQLLAELGITLPGLDPGMVQGQVIQGDPNQMPGAATGEVKAGPYDDQINRYSKMVEDAIATLNSPAPKITQVQQNPFEQLAELFAVHEGGPSNVGAAARLATDRAAMTDAQNMRDYEARIGGAKTSAQYGSSALNYYLDRDAAAQAVDARVKAAELKGQATQAAQAVKADKEARFKIAEQVASGKATPTSIAQLLLGSGMKYELAQATAEELWADIGRDPQSWYRQHVVDTQERLAENAKAEMDFKRNKEWNDILEDPGAKFTQQVQAATNLINAGQFPANSDPVAIAKEMSLEARRIVAQAALAGERTEVERIKKDILATQFKNLPQELADKHAKNQAQIDHWHNIDALAAKLGDFKMQESARDNVIQRYSKALDAFGNDIVSIDKEIESLMIDRRKWIDLRQKIATSGFRPGGAPIAAKKEDQNDLNLAVKRIDEATAALEAKAKTKKALIEEAQNLRKKIEEEDIGAEVEKGRERTTIETPKGTAKAATPPDRAALRKKYGY